MTVNTLVTSVLVVRTEKIKPREMETNFVFWDELDVILNEDSSN